MSFTNDTKNTSTFTNDNKGNVQYLLKEDFDFLLLETGDLIIANGVEQNTIFTNDTKN